MGAKSTRLIQSSHSRKRVYLWNQKTMVAHCCRQRSRKSTTIRNKQVPVGHGIAAAGVSLLRSNS
jgi:hypothetical protein